MRRRQVDSITKHRKLQHILQSLTLEESGSPKLVLHSILITSTIFLSILIWAATTPLDEISYAKGTVVPVGQIPVVQHFEGGIVKKIYVKDGEQVKFGQKLMVLSSANPISELRRLKVKELGLKLELIRLQAFIDNDRDLDVKQITSQIGHPKHLNAEKYNRMVSETLALLQQELNAKNEEETMLKRQVSRLAEENNSLAEQKGNLKTRKSFLNEELDIYKKLNKTNAIPKIRVLTANEKLSDINGDFLEVDGSLKNNNHLLEEAKTRLQNLHTTLIEEAMEIKANKYSQLLEVQDSIQASKDKVGRLTIHSPVDGIIKGLIVDTGSVIPPGGALLEVVPLDKELVVETKVKTEDVGHISINDPVNVKVSAYNYVRYGHIQGFISGISASTFLNDEGLPYYKVMVRLEKHYLGLNPNRNMILPGMTVEAEIITGHKSLLTYLLKPIQRSVTKAFHER
tara:strand:+ start:15822 stop:17192 length:1371 start_codon:yes stop_codon:yes gene_type:complete